MEQYINKKNLLERIGELHVYPLDDGLDVAKRIIQKAPVADVEEVKHGKWIECNAMRRDDGEIYDYCCSKCCGLAGKDDYDNHAILSAYCPNCGAKMDGE